MGKLIAADAVAGSIYMPLAGAQIFIYLDAAGTIGYSGFFHAKCIDIRTAADSYQQGVPDDVIASVASQLRWRPGQGVVHCSGADSTDIFEPARKSGSSAGAFHPLQTFASTEQATANIPGSTFTIEAEGPLASTLQDIATALGGQWIELKAGDKVTYHAAAVIACNYLVTLVKMATDLWQTFGIPRRQATQALLPLIRGTVNNIDAVGIPQCLTGPIARGDGGTITKHITALEQRAPGLLTAYRALGLETIPIALGKGRIDKRQAQGLQTILEAERD